MSDCLTPEQLESFVQNALPSDSASILQAHIDSCPNCQSSFDIAFKNESALNRLKALSPRGGFKNDDNEADKLTIPGYTIIDELKRGGQGVVYRAIQISTQREVAIKVMREGPFAGAADKSRFDREVEILARLKHPNIVSIYDSGRAANHFYFVMDLIDGDAFDTWWSVSNNCPTLRDKLSCFKALCNAVNSAHLRGIMHRDLKPSNVIVDKSGQPHVLDFGLARGTDAASHGMTVTGQFVGSLPWASPEQAQGLAGTIDIRTDVYSIGVMLYQAITGSFPYNVVGGVRDVLDRIINTDPKRPSAVSSEKTDDEIDAIVLKCLEKEPERRYQTAGELARDLRAYLSGEPIEAKRHSFSYLLRKQIRRHRVPVAMAASLFLAVTIGFIATLGLWRRSERLRTQVEAEKRAAVEASERSEAVVEFLQKMLAAVDPNHAGDNRDVTVRQIVDTAAKNLDAGSLTDSPHVEVAVRDTIGTTYQGLGLLDEAERHLRRALEIQLAFDPPDYPNLIVALNGVATLLQDKGAYEEAEPLFRKALQIAMTHLDVSSIDIIKAKNNLAILYYLRGKIEDAKPLIDDIVKAVESNRIEDEYAATSIMASAAILQAEMGDYAAAESTLRQVIESRRREFGDAHPFTTMAISNLGYILTNINRDAEAEPLFREALALDKKIFSAEHSQVATDLNNLGLSLSGQGKTDEAIDVHRQALAIRRKVLPPNHPDTIISLLNLSDTMMSIGRFNEVEPYLKEVLDAPESAWPPAPFAREVIRMRYMSSVASNGNLALADKFLNELRAEFDANPDVPENMRLQLDDFATEFEKAKLAASTQGEQP